ncbi:YggT family protein [Levilactobacillus brevis]|uniref:YggT family protein n=1 Tax=Levilactobacillus hammesii TaxID=267633 RepID=A0A921EZQ2_9LACO|nr:YggT family protein [Levilactobacillus brevis]HJE86458.1 YggT family protein [Levilactobacillus hammesii]
MLTIVNLIFQVLSWAVSAYILLIVVYALMSWLPGAYQSKLGQFIGRLVEPFLSYFNFISVGPLGFGPVVAIIVLSLVQYGLQYLQYIVMSLLY